MSEEELSRLRGHNLALQRRLEAARRDALLYAASLCEDHIVTVGSDGFRLAGPIPDADKKRHAGAAYAAKLREIAK